jgi:hypothetical protein
MLPFFDLDVSPTAPETGDRNNKYRVEMIHFSWADGGVRFRDITGRCPRTYQICWPGVLERSLD